MNLQGNWKGPKLNEPYEDGTTPKHPYCHSGFQIHNTSVSVMLGYSTTSLLDRFPTFQDRVISSSGVKNFMKNGYFYHRDFFKCRSLFTHWSGCTSEENGDSNCTAAKD
jgi:hypothetical protein